MTQTPTETVLPPGTLERLQARHAEPQRHYHTWAHIEALLRWWEKLSGQLCNPQAVKLAILYHDAVYDPRAHDNEAQSAALMLSELAPVLPPATLRKVESLILATAGHRLPESADEALLRDSAFFLDMDLSILGAAPEIFDAYEDGIRQEYAFVPPADYRAGRSAILRDFQGRERLYFTDHFHALLNRQARENLARSLERLT